MVTNKNKVTLGGSWLLLTLLMIGMSWSAAVSPVTDDLQAPENDGTETVVDPLALPDSATNPEDSDQFGYDPSAELIGSRTETAKTFVQDDGDFAVIVSPTPLHYMVDGAWEDIDLNLESNENGWDVTENTFESYFSPDPRQGVQMVVDEQTIRYGIMPQVVILDGNTLSEEPYMGSPIAEPIDVGANVIRYPLLQGISLDYQVEANQLKQNLVIREAPQLLDHQKDSGYFGISETMLIPEGFGLFLGESPIADGELVKTNQSLAIRHLDTGVQLVSIPAPTAMSADPEANLEGPYIGFYVIRITGTTVTLTTVVENTWLMDEDNRTYPLLIDPTLDKSPNNAGYAYYYRISRWGWYSYTYEYAWSNSYLTYTCRGSGNYQTTCTSGSYTWFYYYGWYRFDFNSALPSGATVNSADFKSKVGRYYGGNRNFELTVLKSGSSQGSNPIDPNSYLYSNGMYLNRYIRNSASSSSSTTLSDPNYYWYGGSLRTISFNSNGVNDIQDAIDGNGAGSSGNILGVGLRNTANAPRWYWCSTGYNSYYGCTSATTRPYLHIDYSGGTDTDPPEDDFVPYTDLTTHREEKRTFWLELKDTTGVDTTSNGRPTLNYRVDNGSWTKVTATIIGTCVSGYFCNFKAAIPGVQEGDYVQYFWAFQDLVGTAPGTTGNPNFKTLPIGGSGTPSNPTAPSTPYNYFVQPVEEADAFNSDGTKNNKWQLGISGVNQYRYYSVSRYYDEQLTYYEDSKEWIWEYDTSNCGTGGNSCFNTNNVYHLKFAPNVNGYSYSNCGSYTWCDKVQPGLQNTAAGGYSGGQIFNMNSQHGPQMSTIWYYNTNLGEWGMIGLDSQTGIDKPVVGASVGTQGGGRNCDDCYSAVPIPGDITMKFGSITVNGTYNTGGWNWFCTNSNNHPMYFMRTSSTNPYCLYSYTTWNYDRIFNGWMAPGYDGRWSSGTVIKSKVSTVRPVPDTFPVKIGGDGLMDTHSENARTVTVSLEDAGDPPSGVNISTGTDVNGNLEGPHMLYRIHNGTSWSAWTTRSLNPVGSSRAQCQYSDCDWSAVIPGTDRGNDVEYKLSVQDNLNNWNNTTAYTYNIGTPTKVFTVEWHDQTCGYNSQWMCSWQLKFYDVTNEVEYHYDTGSYAYYNYQTTGYQKGGSTALGATLVERPQNGYIGGNPFFNNFRIATDGSQHAAETMPAGMSELYNFQEELTGSSNGFPYYYYCTRYWSSYRNQCATVIDMPNDFDFEWFGQTYSANSSDTFHANRFGAGAFSTSSSQTPMQMAYYYWGSQWPGMPDTGSYVRNVQFAPWFGYYASYYCYNSGSSECSIRTKTIPFGGAGMDVYSDITTPTIWDKEMSPIRIVPSGDYIRATADLTIEAGVEVQFADGKGIDMAGACSKLTINGNESNEMDGRVTITNTGGSTAANGLGFAFTRGGCSQGTADRHTMENVDFSNLDIAISAGSRHGNSPHYNGNVGDFTMDDVTFTNVGTAISHGSGQYSSFDLSGVSITNATNSCIDLPDYSSLNWVGGSATNCNQGSSSSDGAIMTGYGSEVTLDEIHITNAAHNGIAGGAKTIWAHNVSIDNSGLTSSQFSGSAWGQTYTGPGSSLYLDNIDGGGYATGINSYAVDSIDIMGGFDGGSVSLIPRGPNSAVSGPTDYSLDDITSTGNVYIERTTPSSMNNLNADGHLKMAGTAPTSDQISVKWLTADGITIAGCGWSVRAEGVTLGGSSAGSWATASCTSNSARSELTVMDGSVATNTASSNIFYARNAKVTLANLDVTGQTASGSYVARSSTNGEIRLIGVDWRNNACADANGWTGMSGGANDCTLDVTSSSGKIYVGGIADVYAYRMINTTATFFADHSLTSTTVETSTSARPCNTAAGCSVSTVLTVGTTYTDATGKAYAWLVQDKVEKSGSGVAVTDSYTEHHFEIAGGGGQQEVGPGVVWWNTTLYPTMTHSTCLMNTMACDMPVSPGDSRYIELNAAPIDWSGPTKTCTDIAAAGAAVSSTGHYIYTIMDMTLSTDLVLDGCKVHLNGTSFRVNRTANNNPTITLLNGGELLVSSEAVSATQGFIRPVTSAYGWVVNIESGGTLAVGDASNGGGYLRGMHQNSAKGGALLVEGGTLSVKYGGAIYGAQTVSSTMATVKVDGGTLITDNATIYNAQQTGVGVWLEDTSGSHVQNIAVTGAATGIVVKDSAPTIAGFSLNDNTVGLEIDGGMSLPTVYRSPLLSGASRGWTTYDNDLTALASQHNYIQFGFNLVYEGGNVHPSYNYASSKYYAMWDRMRIALDTGSGPTNYTNAYNSWSGSNNAKSQIGYYDSGSQSNQGDIDSPHPSRNDGFPRYDCNMYGYQYSPGGSYQYGYYYYFLYYASGYSSSGQYYGANSYPREMGFTLDKVDGLTGSQNYYPYGYWGYYYPSWMGGYGDMMPPEGYNGLWGYYNVCLAYAYTYQTPTPNGWRMSWPIVDVQDTSIQGVNAYMDILHNNNDYYADRYEFVFRGADTPENLVNSEWGRTFGKADISSGTIDNADTGILFSGNDATAIIDGVTINDPGREGVLISGRASADMNGITVNDGRYGIRAENGASGNIVATNSALNGQSQDGAVLAGGIKMDLGGTISNASNAGINVLSSSAGVWEFNNLALNDNNIGVMNSGTGQMRCNFCTATGNTMDVQTSSLTTWIEGDINLTRVQADPGGTLERGRLLDLTVEATISNVVTAMSGVGVLMMDGDGKKVASEKSGSGGLVEDLVFYTAYVEPSGLRWVNLSGYKVMSAAKIAYGQGIGDFRYANTGVTLVDAPGNADTISLNDNFDARVCYSWSSTYYKVLASCSGGNYLQNGGSRSLSNGNGGTMDEYGYYQAIPQDMTGKAIMIDAPWTYASSSGADFADSTMIFTGFYNDQYSQLYSNYPYTQDIELDNTDAVAIGRSGKDTEFFTLGWSGSYNYGNYIVNDSTLINIGTIGAGRGYYNRAPVMQVTNSTIVSYSQQEDVQGVYSYDVCISSAGNAPGDFIVNNNVMYDCTVAAMIWGGYYTTGYGGLGTDGVHWANNTVYDSTYLPFWSYLNSNAEDLLVENNTITGTKRTGYGIYSQGQTTISMYIRNNVIYTADEPIYMRNAREWDISGNTIYGDAQAHHSGIYVLNGHGTINDNTLVDSDGGINVYGVRSGYDVELSGNTISASAGRVSPTATGIYVENCGLADVTMSNNHVTTTSNALISDGCDIDDTGSSFNSAGGSASQIHTVNMEANQFNPAIKNISTGDTVRWVLTAYNSGANYQHSTSSNDSLWDSGLLNLGGTFTYTFTSPGSYEYNCMSHSWMYGVVHVSNSTSTSNLATYGVSMLDGNEDVSFNGTSIGGFSLAYAQDGGDLDIKDMVITGGTALELENVDVTIDGLDIAAGANSIAVDVSSSNGRHDLEIDGMSITGGLVGLKADGHDDFRWNDGDSSALTSLQTLSGATGSIENVTWGSETLMYIDAGAYSTITSVGNMPGLDTNYMTIGTSAVVHQAQFLDLTVTHMGSAASDVGVLIKSTDNGRSEMVSPSWRSNIIAVGEGANGAADVTDWFVSHPMGIHNIADDAMPGPVAVNPDPTSQAMGYMTWDNTDLYLMLTGVTFTVTDGMWYLDTQQGGSTVGDSWYVSHNLPFEADYMLWAEDLNNWGIRKVMPGGNWVDVTSACTGMRAAPGFGIPGVTATFSGLSEFSIPWTCIGSPTTTIKTLAIVQAESSGHVAGVYPPQYFDQTCGCAQTFTDFGTLNLGASGSDLADGTLDAFLLVHRTFTATGATAPRNYDITVKVRDVDNIYWDWATESNLSMDQNQDITIDILRAKPAIVDMDDLSVNEDTGANVISLTSKSQDYQDDSSMLSWTVSNDVSNPSNATSPFTYSLSGTSLTITPDADEFGNHRLYVTVTDTDGLSTSQSVLVSVQNVNDAPVIFNSAHSTGMPIFNTQLAADGSTVYNVYDEPQRRNPVTGEEMQWDLLSIGLDQYITDMANEQDPTLDNNSETVPQVYTWSASTDPEECNVFDVSVQSATLVIDLNEANEAGGTCDIVLGLSDGASVFDAAQPVSVPFTLNPVNDQPEILDWNVSRGAYISTSYLDSNGDKAEGKITDTTATHQPWYWQVNEDTTDTDLLTIDLSRMMSDNDHTIEQLTWEVDETQSSMDQCNYHNYFEINIDNANQELSLVLIPDATTDADSSEWDMLQDADGDGTPDDGIHQMSPRSGTFCSVTLHMNDTADASGVPQYDYAQSSTGTYTQGSTSETLYIRVHNIVEPRPDFNFDETRLSPKPVYFQGIDGVLRDTLVPVSVSLEMEGDQPTNPDGTYKYLYDLRVSFYTSEVSGGAGIYQSSVRLGSNGPGDGDMALPDWDDSVEVLSYARLNKTSEDVRVFVDVMTVNPFSGQYTDNTKYEKPALEEKNWADNNMTSSQTSSPLPLIVEVRAAASVASFAPSLMAVGLVGIFVGALLSRSRAIEDEEEFEEENSLIDDEAAVSPVIATILLVAITVVLAGVIYVWAGSLADTSTKGVPQLTFTAESITVQEVSDLPQDQWHWRITTTYAATDLATQAIKVSVLWNNASGQQVYTTSLAPTSGDVEHVYGFAPRNSENMVTMWDDVSACERGGAPCITNFGAGDRIFVRMTDNDGLIDSAQIDIKYELPGGAAYVLKQYTASANSIR